MYTSLSTTTGMYMYTFRTFWNFKIALHSLEIDNMRIYIYIYNSFHISFVSNLEISRPDTSEVEVKGQGGVALGCVNY